MIARVFDPRGPSPVTEGFDWLLLIGGGIVIGIIALIEGIVYLTKDDYDFQATYGDGDKAWF